MTSTNDTHGPNDMHRTDVVDLEDGVLIYDPENPDAWVESDESVALAERR